MMSAFAPVGCDLGAGMLVKKAKIRGVESFGVLLSERELGLTDDHTGIMEFDVDTKPGDVLVDALSLEDWVLEVNVTPNRGDCLSVIGIARELAALFGRKLNKPAISASMAATNIRAIAWDTPTCTTEPTKSMAITMQMNNAPTVHRLIAQWIRRARRESIFISMSASTAALASALGLPFSRDR
jgi:phenylalanyl-tRNA synthetase beta chain